jgi:hypothetical protein
MTKQIDAGITLPRVLIGFPSLPLWRKCLIHWFTVQGKGFSLL